MTTPETVAADKRYRKAIGLAALADKIIPIPGEDAYLVPSSEDGYYRVDAEGCPCPDATYRNTLCKHQIAVGMLRVGSTAVEANVGRIAAQKELDAQRKAQAMAEAQAAS